MLSYIIRRVLAAIPVMAVVALFVFSLLYIAAGDPAEADAGHGRGDAVVIAAGALLRRVAAPLRVERVNVAGGADEEEHDAVDVVVFFLGAGPAREDPGQG